MDSAEYVLQDFNRNEQDFLKLVLEQGAKAVRAFVTDGIKQTMNSYNGSLDA
jgi:peptidyl-tRNA hydrolase